VRRVRAPQSRAWLCAAVLNLALVVIGVAGHHWVSSAFWLAVSVVAGIFAYRRPRTVALDPYDYRVQVRLGRRFAAGIAVWGVALVFVGRRGHRGHLDAGNILAFAPFFAVSLLLLALSVFWGTPRGRRRLLLLREQAEAKQAKIAAAVPPEPPESAPWVSPPYFGT
jgi:hypothetical protein